MYTRSSMTMSDSSLPIVFISGIRPMCFWDVISWFPRLTQNDCVPDLPPVTVCAQCECGLVDSEQVLSYQFERFLDHHVQDTIFTQCFVRTQPCNTTSQLP